MYPETTSQPQFINSQRPTFSGNEGIMVLIFYIVSLLYEADFYNFILQVQITTEQPGKKNLLFTALPELMKVTLSLFFTKSQIVFDVKLRAIPNFIPCHPLVLIMRPPNVMVLGRL